MSAPATSKPHRRLGPARSLGSDGRQARFVRADLEQFEDAQRLAAEAGEIDVLVNNAGAFPFGRTHEIAGQVFDSTFALTVKAPFFLTAAFAPRMAANGGGAIVNITMMVAKIGMPGMSPYGSTKAALTLLTHGGRPSTSPREFESTRSRRTRRGRLGPPRWVMGWTSSQRHCHSADRRRRRKIAAAAVFLGSHEAAYVNGAVRARHPRLPPSRVTRDLESAMPILQPTAATSNEKPDPTGRIPLSANASPTVRPAMAENIAGQTQSPPKRPCAGYM
jgi:NAD(P)-dependent dehydrogenase (short-subunit alcohol dehydrogenase family)